MPKGRGKEFQGSDEVELESYEAEEEPITEEGYYTGEEEGEKIESIIQKHTREDESEPPPEPEPVSYPKPPKRELGTGETIYLYIHTSVGVYTLVDRSFPSHIEASRYAETNFPGTRYKTMTETEVKAHATKMTKRAERIDKAKIAVATTAKTLATKQVKPRVQKYGGAALRASYGVAASHGMTRETMEPRIERAWGVQQPQQYQQPQPPQQPQQYQQPQQPRQPTFQQPQQRPQRPQRYQQPRRRPFQQPQQPRHLMRTAPQQRQRGIHIPLGGGVFGSQGGGFKSTSQQSPFQRRPIKTKPAFGKTIPQPLHSMHFNFDGLHMVGTRGINSGRRQQYEQSQPQTTKRPKTKHKTKTKSKKKGGK